MEDKILSVETGDKVLDVAVRLAKQYPEHFIFEFHPSGIFKDERSFYLSTFKQGSIPLFRFKKDEPDGVDYNSDLIVHYSNYAFIDFFKRIGYMLDFAKDVEDLIWLVVWSEFFIWNSDDKSLYSREPMDFITLACENRSKHEKLKMLSAGLYRKNDLEKYSDVPFVFLQRMFDFPDLEKTVNRYKAPTVIVSV